MSAWLAGGTGLVGNQLLQQLLAETRMARVIAVGRRPLPFTHDRLTQAVVDFARPDTMTELPAPDVAFCCLGTTIKKAGSRAAFRAIDHDAVVQFAQTARARGAHTFLHVSSLGASTRAGNFYLRVKGETEDAVAALGFTSVYALRPSILDGERSESRPAERLGLAVGRALGPLLGKYRPTPVTAVAATMLRLALQPTPGAHVVESTDIR